MTTLKDFAEAYEPQRMKNIADMEAVSVQQTIHKELKKNKDGEEYSVATIKTANAEGVIEEYRVPNSVVEQLKAILKEKPDLQTFKVNKTGEGLNTSYTVIQLE